MLQLSDALERSTWISREALDALECLERLIYNTLWNSVTDERTNNANSRVASRLKNGSHLASDLGFSYSGLYQRFNKMSTSGPNGPRFCMEGINGIRCPGKKNRGHTASDLRFWSSSLYPDLLSNDPGTFKSSPGGTFGISITLPEAGLHQSSGKAKLTTGPVLKVSQFLRGCWSWDLQVQPRGYFWD